MTRKVTLMALAVAIAALLVPAGGAAAAPPSDIRAAASGQQIRSAAFGPLTRATARRLAVKLARSAARERGVRWWTLSDPVSVRSNRITFDYGDRRGAVFCGARIVVEQPSRQVRRTRFAAGECAGVPSEALAVEQATSRLIRAAQGRSSDLRRSIGRFDQSLADCEELRVPRSRLDHVRRLFLASEALATVGPIHEEIGAFVAALQELRIQRGDLARGIAHWDGFHSAVAGLATTLLNANPPCEAARRWADAGWAADAAPVDLEKLRQGIDAARAAERGIERAALSLASLGVSPRVVLGFTPAGLVELAVVPRR